MKTDDYFEIKSHEPLGSDCICASCVLELNGIPLFDPPKNWKDIIKCTHEDYWGPTTMDGIRCFICSETGCWS